MKTIKVTNHTKEFLTKKAVKIAGFMFLAAFIVPTLNWTFILSKFIVAGDSIATAKNILSNELMYRIGISLELIMSIGLVILGIALYVILKTGNKSLGLLALSLKLVEASLAVVITLGSFIALLLISDDGSNLSVIGKEQMLAFSGFVLQKHTLLYSIPMLFLGLDMMLFSFLFCKSNYIPKILARFGMISFMLILIFSFMNILVPEYAELPIIQAIFWAPSGIFEIIIGIWLLFVNLQPNLDTSVL